MKALSAIGMELLFIGIVLLLIQGVILSINSISLLIYGIGFLGSTDNLLFMVIAGVFSCLTGAVIILVSSLRNRLIEDCPIEVDTIEVMGEHLKNDPCDKYGLCIIEMLGTEDITSPQVRSGFFQSLSVPIIMAESIFSCSPNNVNPLYHVLVAPAIHEYHDGYGGTVVPCGNQVLYVIHLRGTAFGDSATSICDELESDQGEDLCM